MHVRINGTDHPIEHMELTTEKLELVLMYPAEELVSMVGTLVDVDIVGDDGEVLSNYSLTLSCFCLDPQSSNVTSQTHENRLVFEFD